MAAAAAARRRAAQRRRRLTHYTVAAVAAALSVTLAILLFDADPTPSPTAAAEQILPSRPTGARTIEQPARRIPDDSGIPGVLAWDTGDWPGVGASTRPDALEHAHVDGPVTYAVTPPVGGPHNPVWMNAGVYTEPVPPERAVHNMEHGAVWLTYRPDLPRSQVQALTDFVAHQTLIDESGATGIGGQHSRYLDMSPWSDDHLPAPIVISAWAHQLRIDDPRDPRLQQFVDTFRSSPRYSPEYGEAVDGVPVGTGGRPAGFGATEPNPPGTGGGGAGMGAG